MACADVSSANTVGYSVNSLSNSYLAVGSSFVSIGADGFKLSELKLTGVPSDLNNSKVRIELLDGLGVTDKTYCYYKGARAPHATEGWYIGTTKERIDGSDDAHEVIFNKGQGLWVKGVDNVTFTTSGEVLAGDFSIALTNSYLMVANPFPAPIKLSELKLAGVPSDMNNSKVRIELLDGLGVTDKTYCYYKGARAPHATEGWYIGTTKERIDGSDDAHEVIFQPGQAMWVKAVDGVTATITCPYTLNEKAAD